jgi:hypothetical protein
MRKLRALLAGVLLTIPMLTVNASSLTAVEADGMSAPSITGICYIYIGGRWYAYPC